MLRMAFIDVWASAILFLPKLLLAVVVFLVGLLIAQVLKATVERVVKALKIDDALHRLEVAPLFARTGMTLDVGLFLGWLVKWFVIIFALIAAADVLDWDQITVFLNEVVAYLPNVLIAVIILLVGTVLAGFVHSVVRAAILSANMRSAGFLAGVAKWSIIVFSFMAALVQLGIAESLIQVLFTGFVAMIALAGGLAFGLGGREHAAKVLDGLKKDLSGSESQESAPKDPMMGA